MELTESLLKGFADGSKKIKADLDKGIKEASSDLQAATIKLQCFLEIWVKIPGDNELK